MNKLSKSFKDEFNNIKINPKDDNKIYNSIVNKKHSKHIIFKLSTALVIVLVFVFVGIANADVIKERIRNSWVKKTTVITENGEKNELVLKVDPISSFNVNAKYKTISPQTFRGTCPGYDNMSSYIDRFYGIDLNDIGCLEQYTFEEIEEELNIKLLRNKMYGKNKLIVYSVERDDTIKSLSFKMPNIGNLKIKNYNKNKVVNISEPFTIIDAYINMKNYKHEGYNVQGLESKYNTDSETMFVMDERHGEEYYIKQLDTTAIIYDKYKQLNVDTNGGLRYPSNYGQVTIRFIYDDIFYVFDINRYDREKIDIIQIAKDFLDSFYLEDN